MMRRWIFSLLVLLAPASLVAATAGTVTVVAEQNGEVMEALVDNATIVKQIEYIGLDAGTEPVTTSIDFTGTAATPNATVMITIPEAQVSQTSTVDATGQWNIDVPTQQLTDGNYYAYVAAADEDGSGMGASKPVAYFTVQADQNLSLATWVFLITSSVTVFVLLLAITLQLRYNSQHHAVV